MKEARAEADRSRDTVSVANPLPDGGERRNRLRIASDVCGDRDVVAGPDSRQDALDGFGRGLDFGAFKDPRRRILRLLDVRLVERIDTDDMRCDRGCELPAEELGAHLHRVPRLVRQAHDGMPGGFEGSQLRVIPDCDEQPVAAIHLRTAQRLPFDGQNAAPLLARGFGDELLNPTAEWRDLIRKYERDFVSPGKRCFSHHRAEPRSRVVPGRHFPATGAGHLLSTGDECSNIDSQQGSRHKPKQGEGRVAASDVRWVPEDPAHAEFSREIIHGAAGIRYNDEVLAVWDLLPKVSELGPCFDRAPALARHDEQRGLQVDAVFQVTNLSRVRAIQHLDA